ncbi:MAG: M15 family metallopeptidase, partial [Propionibacteriaceae bacterium]|nr:M15 family metallopeptidase [Propionibacteriaceae bacterium]
ETGLAADIMATGISQTDLAASPEGRWLAANAWRFGLILRYPAGKESVTGIAYEPWHFRYVGQPHASYCHAHGLTLEEYIDFLHQWGGYETTVDGTAYKVRYERDDAPPAGDRTTVSADNTGGYIVTTW